MNFFLNLENKKKQYKIESYMIIHQILNINLTLRIINN